MKLLPRAEKHHRQGCNTRAAWGRASAEWPEYQSGRRLVELFVVWKTTSGNLERRFRRIDEIHVPELAQLLDVSIEKCVFVEQAPPSKFLRLSDPSKASASASLHQTEKNRYFEHILKLHAKLHGSTKTRIRLVERRDAGTLREGVESRCGPETDAAFGRKREAAIAEVVAASPSKRA